MYEDLTKALRGYTYWLERDEPCSHDIHPPVCNEAADAIERLESEKAALQERLAAEKSYSDKYEAEAGYYADLYERECVNVAADYKAQLEAAVRYIRTTGWCAGCRHFKGLDGCGVGEMEACTGENDLYEFGVSEDGGNDD